MLADSWERARLQGQTEIDQDVNRRIDHFFISPVMGITAVRFANHVQISLMIQVNPHSS